VLLRRGVRSAAAPWCCAVWSAPCCVLRLGVRPAATPCCCAVVRSRRAPWAGLLRRVEHAALMLRPAAAPSCCAAERARVRRAAALRRGVTGQV
jgi:hypothetical protein